MENETATSPESGGFRNEKQIAYFRNLVASEGSHSHLGKFYRRELKRLTGRPTEPEETVQTPRPEAQVTTPSHRVEIPQPELLRSKLNILELPDYQFGVGYLPPEQHGCRPFVSKDNSDPVLRSVSTNLWGYRGSNQTRSGAIESVVWLSQMRKEKPDKGFYSLEKVQQIAGEFSTRGYDAQIQVNTNGFQTITLQRSGITFEVLCGIPTAPKNESRREEIGEDQHSIMFLETKGQHNDLATPEGFAATAAAHKEALPIFLDALYTVKGATPPTRTIVIGE